MRKGHKKKREGGRKPRETTGASPTVSITLAVWTSVPQGSESIRESRRWGKGRRELLSFPNYIIPFYDDGGGKSQVGWKITKIKKRTT